MKTRILTAGLVSGALLTGHAQPASADAFAGGLIGGIIGGAIGSNVRTTPRRTVVVSSVAREQNVAVQSALNFFGFDAGTPDGAFGPRTRGAISAYQIYLGFPATGQITEIERQILVTAHQRAQLGGPQVTRITSRHRDGMRGMLEAQRDEMQGGRSRTAGAYGLPPDVADAVDDIAASSDPTAEQLVQRTGFVQLVDLNGDGRNDYILDTSLTGSAFWCNATECTVQVFVSTPDGYVRNDFRTSNATPAAFDCIQSSCRLSDTATTTVAAAPAAPSGPLAPPVTTAIPLVPNPGGGTTVGATMPNLFGAAPVQVSLASHCNRVSLVTMQNGGLTDIGTMRDPLFTLNEQFCLARGHAIAEGEAILAQVPGVTPQMVAEQCGLLGGSLQASIAALSVQARDAVMAGVTQVVLSSGMSPTDLAANARICLSNGYATDTLNVALGSSLILVALGETAYGELPAHHLMQGIGAAQRRDLASEWFAASLPVAGAGSVAVSFQPGPESRVALIRAALDGVNGVPTAAPAPLLQPIAPQVEAPAASK